MTQAEKILIKTSRIDYPFEIRALSKDEGGGYSITFIDLPGCWSDGATPEEAINNGRDALESWLVVAREYGDKILLAFSGVSGRIHSLSRTARKGRRG